MANKREQRLRRKARAATSHVLAPGDEAWCLLLEVAGKHSRSGTRWTLVGAARVRVDAIQAGACEVTVLAANPSWHEGRHLSRSRGELYARTNPVELREFGALIARFWPSSEVNPRRSA